jgi:hypothetical protein
VQRLRYRRTGDNYDLARFTRIAGVVCSPEPVWVPLGRATALLELGLRASCSLSELVQWLETGSTGSATHAV